jgi:hypothetical protein
MHERRETGDDHAEWRTRVRLAWRWKGSGQQGAGPWSHRADVVETLRETLDLRFHDRMDHWVEAERDAGRSGTPGG